MSKGRDGGSDMTVANRFGCYAAASGGQTAKAYQGRGAKGQEVRSQRTGDGKCAVAWKLNAGDLQTVYFPARPGGETGWFGSLAPWER